MHRILFFFFLNDPAPPELPPPPPPAPLPLHTNRRDRNPTDNVTWTSAISIEVVLIGPLIARSKMRMSSNTTINTRKIKSRSEEHTSELQSQSNLVCRLLLEKKKR